MESKEQSEENNPRKLYDVIREAYVQMEVEMKTMLDKEAAWEALMQKVSENAANAPKKIKLDIGGQTFTTSKENLLRHENSFFHAMIGSGNWTPDEDGVYFIDRDPTYFHYVLECMRSGNNKTFVRAYNHLKSYEIQQIQAEFDYYQLPFDEYCVWDTNVATNHLSYTEDGRVVTKTKAAAGWDANCISKLPVTRFKVEIVNRGSDNNGSIMIGFVDPAAFSANGQIYAHQNSYVLYVADGNLYGNGKSNSGYGNSVAIAVGQTVESIFDPEQKTISFTVDGVSRGVAFTGVTANALHATCHFYSHNNQVKLFGW